MHLNRWNSASDLGRWTGCRDPPVQRPETAHVQGQPVFRTGVVMEQPAADAGAAVSVFTWRLEGALQHISTHTAEETLIDIAHKPLQIIAHPASSKVAQVMLCCQNLGEEFTRVSSLTNTLLPEKLFLTSSNSSLFPSLVSDFTSTSTDNLSSSLSAAHFPPSSPLLTASRSR